MSQYIVPADPRFVPKPHSTQYKFRLPAASEPVTTGVLSVPPKLVTDVPTHFSTAVAVLISGSNIHTLAPPGVPV